MVTTLAALKLRETGSAFHAVFLGVAGAMATLTRITSLSLVLPLLVALVLWPGTRPFRQRARAVGLSALVFLLLVAPFLISCWIVLGDPFASINMVTRAYYGRGSIPLHAGVLNYLGTQFRPFQLLDTAFIGYTLYPFTPKWHFEDWWSPLGPSLAGLSLVGALLLALTPRGRLLWL